MKIPNINKIGEFNFNLYVVVSKSRSSLAEVVVGIITLS